jgi:hypothetical protein
MLEKVLCEVDKVISVSEARRLLEEQHETESLIELANPDLQPVAFRFINVHSFWARLGAAVLWK